MTVKIEDKRVRTRLRVQARMAAQGVTESKLAHRANAPVPVVLAAISGAPDCDEYREKIAACLSFPSWRALEETEVTI